VKKRPLSDWGNFPEKGVERKRWLAGKTWKGAGGENNGKKEGPFGDHPCMGGAK